MEEEEEEEEEARIRRRRRQGLEACKMKAYEDHSNSKPCQLLQFTLQ